MCFCLSWAALNKPIIDLSSGPYAHNLSRQETYTVRRVCRVRLSHPWPGCDGQNAFQPLLHQPPSHTPGFFLPSSQWQIAHTRCCQWSPSPRFKFSPPPLDPQCSTTTRSKGPAHPCLIPSPVGCTVYTTDVAPSGVGIILVVTVVQMQDDNPRHTTLRLGRPPEQGSEGPLFWHLVVETCDTNSWDDPEGCLNSCRSLAPPSPSSSLLLLEIPSLTTSSRRDFLFASLFLFFRLRLILFNFFQRLVLPRARVANFFEYLQLFSSHSLDSVSSTTTYSQHYFLGFLRKLKIKMHISAMVVSALAAVASGKLSREESRREGEREAWHRKAGQ